MRLSSQVSLCARPGLQGDRLGAFLRVRLPRLKNFRAVFTLGSPSCASAPPPSYSSALPDIPPKSAFCAPLDPSSAPRSAPAPHRRRHCHRHRHTRKIHHHVHNLSFVGVAAGATIRLDPAGSLGAAGEAPLVVAGADEEEGYLVKH